MRRQFIWSVFFPKCLTCMQKRCEAFQIPKATRFWIWIVVFLQLSYHLTHHMNLEYRLINLRLRSTPNPQKFYQVAGHMSSRRQHSCAVSAEEYLALSFWDWLALGRIQVSGGRLSIHLTSLSSCSNDASWQ